LNLVKSTPKDVVNFSIDWLMNKGGYTSNGLLIEEKQELLQLRKEIKKLRELEAEAKKSDSRNFLILEAAGDSDEDEDDEIENETDNLNSHNTLNSNVRGPRIAVSAEAYGEFNKKENFKPKVFHKTEEQQTSIKVRLIQSFFFNSLDFTELNIIINAMELKQFTNRETVIVQGDHGDCLYVVDKGNLNCYKKFSNGESKLVKTYSEGDAFGELALLYNCPRAAEVVASEDVTLWKLDRETFNVIVKEAAV
jgi:cAMP-dependent protein kinase regulator